MGEVKSVRLFCTFGLLEVVYRAFSSCDNGNSWSLAAYVSGGGLLWPSHQKGTFNLNLEQFSSTKALLILESKDICKWSFTIWAPRDISPPNCCHFKD